MSEMTTATSTDTTNAGEPTTADSTANLQGTAATETTAATEGQPTTETKGDEPQVPEAYDLKMPEGVELDTAAADEFSAIAKELKLNQEQAQKVADIGAKMAQRQAEAHVKLVESWVEQVKTDKEIGGDKLTENLAVARKALDSFGTPALRDVLNATGFGNHPEVIKAFYKIGKAISEDGFVKGTPPGASSDPAKKLFPNMN